MLQKICSAFVDGIHEGFCGLSSSDQWIGGLPWLVLILHVCGVYRLPTLLLTLVVLLGFMWAVGMFTFLTRDNIYEDRETDKDDPDLP